MTVTEALQGHSRVYLDSMFFIYLQEDHPHYGPVCQEVVRLALDGTFEIVTSV